MLGKIAHPHCAVPAPLTCRTFAKQLLCPRRKMTLGVERQAAANAVAVEQPGTAKQAHGQIPEHVQDLVNKQPAKLYINGEYVDAASGKTYDNICPFTAQPFGKVAEGDAQDIDAAVKAAREAFDHGPWGKMSGRERGRLIQKFADLLEANAQELATLEAFDNGKAIGVASAVDIPHSIDVFRYFAGAADKIKGDTIDTNDGTLCTTYKEPIGVVGAIIPWNFPLAMLTWKAAPALAAGCTMVIKCAEQTPLTALKAAVLAVEAGIPPGVLNVIPGYGPTAGAALCAHPGVDKIGFTGSLATGSIVAKAAAENVKPVSLELGGKSPLIVTEDADMDVAVKTAHLGLFFNHGQTCCASSRVFCHEKVYDEFMSRITEAAKNIKVASPFEEDCFQGPQVDSEQFDKVMHYIKVGKESGAQLMCGGAAVDREGFFVQPTVFGNVMDDMEIAVDEIFGPVLSCSKYTDLDDALERANQTEYGLLRAAHRFRQRYG
eukprot:TRINITY_DN4495_c0_g2_i1.p1 TRINITY_DN4495_c0_g2~~TRINITY_DN4495_c0_g2_i1.p1  ORF type:complete len:507 (-),score=88.23 TRINITY_DN4495_c0_g2_i1:920-2392(-)